MGMFFEELNSNPRTYMQREFATELQSANPYRSASLTAAGLSAFPDLMTQALASGNEQTLTAALAQSGYWLSSEIYVLKGVARERKINF